MDDEDELTCPRCDSHHIDHRGLKGYNLDGSFQETDWFECRNCGHCWEDETGGQVGSEFKGWLCRS